MRGRFLVLAALLALAVVPAATSQSAKTTAFRITSAKATATLVFHTHASNQGSDGTVKLAVLQRSSAAASVPGHALVRLKGTLRERVKMRQRVSETSPYEEQVCANTREIAGRGGVRLKQTGSKIAAFWAFPQAKPSFCRGPSVKTVIKRLYPAAYFARHSVSVVLTGTKRVKTASMTATYTWRAVVKLSR